MFIKAIKREVGPNRWWHITFIFGNYLSEIRQLILKRSLVTREGKQEMGFEIGAGIRIRDVAQC